MFMKKVKVRGKRSMSQRSRPSLALSGPHLQFEFTYDEEMMHKTWCCLGEVPSNFQVTRKKKSPILTRIEHIQFEFTVGFGMMCKAWSSIEDVLFCFSMSSISFQCYKGWKIDDFNPIWVRLLGWSQLSNPSNLPCFTMFTSTQLYLDRGFWSIVKQVQYIIINFQIIVEY